MSTTPQNIQIKKRIPVPHKSHPFLIRFLVTALLMILVFGISIAISLYAKEINTPPPTSFEECEISKGSVIRESYPPVCVAKNGNEFVKKIDQDNIVIPESENEGAGDGKFCGGIAGLPCPDGFSCKLDGNYPDAGGTCIKN